MSYLGKRSAAVAGFMRKNTGPRAAYRGSMYPSSGTRYRSYRRVFRRAGPFRTGGFYGGSVRGRAEQKVIDTTLTATAFATAGSVTLLNGAWCTEIGFVALVQPFSYHFRCCYWH